MIIKTGRMYLLKVSVLILETIFFVTQMNVWLLDCTQIYAIIHNYDFDKLMYFGQIKDK